MINVLKYIALIGTFFIYTTSGVFSKLASQREFLSPGYIAFLACTVGVLGIYAVPWQQIIKRMDVSLAYMFKGTGVARNLLNKYVHHTLTFSGMRKDELRTFNLLNP